MLGKRQHRRAPEHAGEHLPAGALVTLLLAFGSLTVAWLGVAAGFQRQA